MSDHEKITHACEICEQPQYATHGTHTAMCEHFQKLRDRVAALEQTPSNWRSAIGVLAKLTTDERQGLADYMWKCWGISPRGGA